MADAASALREAAARLEGVSATARLDAELLMAHAAGIERGELLLRLRDMAAPAGFAALVERRAAHEPVAYILGYRDFWSVRIKVAPGVLIPRADSETLIEAGIEAAVAAFGEPGPATILDLGCGPGTLLFAALDEWRDAHGLGIERSAVARALAMDNAEALGLADRAEIRAGDWTAAGWTEAIGARFDLILCNPPYVAPEAELMREVADYEPAEALYAADEGLADYRIIIAALPALLSENGSAVIELGAGQAGDVGALADAAELAWATRDDLGGHARAMVVKRG
ncbi:peptide chain release factor N(5)-glutamine methyltransferase [Sphingorhabdus soli]|uniref:Peptide chain release factor N(5)-glutamine methyltransferase n=1 Tax=Flavisphingopyxis soli TaxID=2601267 RepID=A0A5C6UKE0_9SPHN|nr:peptide chain release factor N(5)-glutamine methyltransferase [Sphingorhabdus soli]TXC73219.1 peptide chain release factor N(5)-glutamine methyltransferase [Sphingorhabdus soli]